MAHLNRLQVFSRRVALQPARVSGASAPHAATAAGIDAIARGFFLNLFNFCSALLNWVWQAFSLTDVSQTSPAPPVAAETSAVPASPASAPASITPIVFPRVVSPEEPARSLRSPLPLSALAARVALEACQLLSSPSASLREAEARSLVSVVIPDRMLAPASITPFEIPKVVISVKEPAPVSLVEVPEVVENSAALIEAFRAAVDVFDPKREEQILDFLRLVLDRSDIFSSSTHTALFALRNYSKLSELSFLVKITWKKTFGIPRGIEGVTMTRDPLLFLHTILSNPKICRRIQAIREDVEHPMIWRGFQNIISSFYRYYYCKMHFDNEDVRLGFLRSLGVGYFKGVDGMAAILGKVTANTGGTNLFLGFFDVLIDHCASRVV